MILQTLECVRMSPCVVPVDITFRSRPCAYYIKDKFRTERRVSLNFEDSDYDYAYGFSFSRHGRDPFRSKYSIRVAEFSPRSPKYTVCPPLRRSNNLSNTYFPSDDYLLEILCKTTYLKKLSGRLMDAEKRKVRRCFMHYNLYTYVQTIDCPLSARSRRKLMIAQALCESNPEVGSSKKRRLG